MKMKMGEEISRLKVNLLGPIHHHCSAISSKTRHFSVGILQKWKLQMAVSRLEELQYMDTYLTVPQLHIHKDPALKMKKIVSSKNYS